MEKESSTRDNITFEDAIKELEEVVKKLEEGNIPLETSLELFKKGVTLTECCNNILTKAQNSVKLLYRDKSNSLTEIPFEVGNEDD